MANDFALKKRSARDRILDAATELFDPNGYGAVGIDTIIAEAGVAKRTLYRHFASKDELIAAYLERTNAEYLGWIDEEIAKVDAPVEKLRTYLALVQQRTTNPATVGCTFQVAAAEFPNLEHLGHKEAAAHKDEVRGRLRKLACEAGLLEPDLLADELLLLIDGAWAAARMFGAQPETPANVLTKAADVLIESHTS